MDAHSRSGHQSAPMKWQFLILRGAWFIGALWTNDVLQHRRSLMGLDRFGALAACRDRKINRSLALEAKASINHCRLRR